MFKKIAAVVAAVLVGAGAGVAVKATTSDAESPATFTAGARPTGPDSDAPSIEELIAQLQVVDELPFVPEYDRAEFTTQWTRSETERPSCDARYQVLRDQLVNVEKTVTPESCAVTRGTLHDPYTGQTLEYQPGTGTIEVDHVVPLLIAWRSGAADWTPERRAEFANDTEWNLLATAREANQAKSAATLGEWLPPNVAFQCEYAHNYLTVAAHYNLQVTGRDIDTARTTCTQN
ncbi:DUF1524 domain-containing protein [Rhodococcus hoagii]|nr:DUF1524 domain-containing protein [Prescottella equi]